MLVRSFFASMMLLLLMLGQSASAELLDPSQLKETSVTVNKKKKRIFCYGKVSGTAKAREDKLNFTPFSQAIKKLTARSQRAKKAELVILKKAADKECKKIALLPTPTPTASPTPSIPIYNFDSMGNVTAQGKITFGIPQHLSGNISIGRNIYLTNCVGCHIERNGRTFPQYRDIIARSPMLFDEFQIPDQELADLVAYMNRFRP